MTRGIVCRMAWMLAFFLLIFNGVAHGLEITGQVEGLKDFPGAIQIEAAEMELYIMGLRNDSLFKQYLGQAVTQKIPITFYYDPYQWGPKGHQTCYRVNKMEAKTLGVFLIEGDKGYWKKTSSGDRVEESGDRAQKHGTGPEPAISAQPQELEGAAEPRSEFKFPVIPAFDLSEPLKIFPDEWPVHMEDGIPPDNVVTLVLERFDRRRLRKRIREELAEKYNVYAFGQGLDEMVGLAEKHYDLIYSEFNLARWWVTLKIPDYFTRFNMDFKMKVNKKKLKLFVYHQTNPRDVLLLETSVALGGSGYDHAQGRRRGFGTPSGSFYIKRIISYPYWFPPNWAKQTSPSKPGPNNPYGIWMSELSGDEEPGSYSFAVAKDTNVRIHSTNRPNSIGQYASHGCIRVHPDVADELFPALLRYVPHQEGKKNHRGTIFPLNRTIPVNIMDR